MQRALLSSKRPLVSESPIDLDRELPGVVVVRSSECVALVEQVSLVEQVHRGQLERPVVPSRTGGEVDRGVTREVVRAVAVEEAGAVVEVSSDPERARQLRGHAGAERVSLVMIEEESPFLRRCEIGEAAGDTTLSLDRLGVGNVGPDGNI